METPRWLYAHDKYEHARSNVRKMASFSGMEIDDDTFDKFEFDMVGVLSTVVSTTVLSNILNDPVTSNRFCNTAVRAHSLRLKVNVCYRVLHHCHPSSPLMVSGNGLITLIS